MKNLLALSMLLLPVAASGSTDPMRNLRFNTSPFAACKDMGFVSRADYLKDKEFWDVARECPGMPVQVLPDAGFLSSFVGHVGEADENLRSVHFLTRVGQRARTDVEFNSKLNEVLQACAKKDENFFKTKKAAATTDEDKALYDMGRCGRLLADMRKVLDEEGPKARVHNEILRRMDTTVLAGVRGLGRGVGHLWGMITGADEASRTNVDPPFRHQPLSDAEKKEVEELMAKNKKEVDEAFEKKVQEQMAKVAEIRRQNPALNAVSAAPNVPAWFKEWYRESDRGTNPNSRQAQLWKEKEMLSFQNEQWDKHMKARQEALGRAQILSFLDKRDPTDTDIAKAAGLLLENNQNNIKYINDRLAEGQRLMTARTERNGRASRQVAADPAAAAKALMGLVRHGDVVARLLEEGKGADCQTATGIANYLRGSEQRNMVGLFAAMAVTGGVAGIGAAGLGAGAAGIGVAVSAGLLPVSAVGYFADYRKYADAQQRTFSAAHTVEGREGQGRSVAEMKEFDETRNELIFSAAGSVLDLSGLGIGAGLARAGSAGMRRLVLQPVARNRLVRQLESRGLAQADASRLVRELTDPASDAQFTQALARVMQETNIAPAEMNLARSLIRTRVILPDQQSSQFNSLLGRLREMPEAERSAVLRNMDETLAKVNSAKINPANRVQVLDAISSGSMAGASPERLAAIVNDWDPASLDGLARAYDAARRHLPNGGRTPASNATELEAAFVKGLDDMRAAHPELRNMPQKDWEELRGKMSSCPLSRGAA